MKNYKLKKDFCYCDTKFFKLHTGIVENLDDVAYSLTVRDILGALATRRELNNLKIDKQNEFIDWFKANMEIDFQPLVGDMLSWYKL